MTGDDNPRFAKTEGHETLSSEGLSCSVNLPVSQAGHEEHATDERKAPRTRYYVVVSPGWTTWMSPVKYGFEKEKKKENKRRAFREEREKDKPEGFNVTCHGVMFFHIVYWFGMKTTGVVGIYKERTS